MSFIPGRPVVYRFSALLVFVALLLPSAPVQADEDSWWSPTRLAGNLARGVWNGCYNIGAFFLDSGAICLDAAAGVTGVNFGPSAFGYDYYNPTIVEALADIEGGGTGYGPIAIGAGYTAAVSVGGAIGGRLFGATGAVGVPVLASFAMAGWQSGANVDAMEQSLGASLMPLALSRLKGARTLTLANRPRLSRRFVPSGAGLDALEDRINPSGGAPIIEVFRPRSVLTAEQLENAVINPATFKSDSMRALGKGTRAASGIPTNRAAIHNSEGLEWYLAQGGVLSYDKSEHMDQRDVVGHLFRSDGDRIYHSMYDNIDDALAANNQMFRYLENNESSIIANLGEIVENNQYGLRYAHLDFSMPVNEVSVTQYLGRRSGVVSSQAMRSDTLSVGVHFFIVSENGHLILAPMPNHMQPFINLNR